MLDEGEKEILEGGVKFIGCVRTPHLEQRYFRARSLTHSLASSQL